MEKNDVPMEVTLDESLVQIKGGAGKWEYVLVPYLKAVIEARADGMEWRTKNTSFTPTEATINFLKTGRLPYHEVLEVTSSSLPGYAVLADARDLGEKDLMVSWKLVFNKFEQGFFRGFAQQQGWTDPMKLSPYKQMHLAQLKLLTKAAMNEAVRNFGNQLDDDFSKEDERSRGIDSMNVKKSTVGRDKSEMDKRAERERERSHGIETIEL